MLNRVVLVGRLTKDVELRYTPNGVAVGNFTMAVNRPFGNQEGKKEADFINCVVWRKQAENTANYTSKGNLIGIDGRLQTRSYENSEGKKVFITEVVCDSVQFLEPKKDGQQPKPQPNNQTNQFSNDPFADNGKPIEINDDDLPF